MNRFLRWLAAILPERVRPELAHATGNARAVFRHADERARAEGGVLEPQHILYGLTAHWVGVAACVLKRLGISAEWLSDQVPLAPGGSGRAAAAVWGESVRALVKQARAESRSLAHNYVGTEHLLLALARLDSGTVAEVFGRLGVRYEAIREGTRDLLGP